MPKKNPPDPKEKPQRQRFVDFAREHGADKDDKALERTFKKVAKQPKDN
jgi:hypothetical protein